MSSAGESAGGDEVFAEFGSEAPRTRRDGPSLSFAGTGGVEFDKFKQSDGVRQSNGQPTNTDGLTPLAGIDFALFKVEGVDLTSNDGWTIVSRLTDGELAWGQLNDPINPSTVVLDGRSHNLTPVGTPQTTGTDGVVSWSNLDLALYVVIEVGTGSHNVIAKVNPFLVTIPMPQEPGGWLYDVYAYPKNSVTGIDKVVVDSDAYDSDDVVTWNITTDVLGTDSTHALSRYVITDTLPDGVDYLDTYTVTGVAADNSPVTIPTSAYVVSENGQVLTLTFNADGLELLNDALVNGKVTWSIDTMVTDGGLHENTAQLVTGVVDVDTEGNPVPGTETIHDPIEDDAETPWGAVRIYKYATGTQTPLGGGEFQICTTEPSSGNACDPGTQVGATLSSELDGMTDGQVLKAGVYWLVETKAPTGYTGLSEPLEFSVSTEQTLDLELIHTVNVANKQAPAFNLPNAGGLGLVLLIGGGVVLLGGAAALSRVNRRREAEQAA